MAAERGPPVASVSRRPTSILDLPARQLEILVAFACSWAARGAPPKLRELGALRGLTSGGCADAFPRLVMHGLLEQRWENGRPLRGVYQPTGAAWRQLGEYGLVRPAEAA